MKEVKSWQAQTAELSSRLTALSIEKADWQRQAEEAQYIITELNISQKPTRASRKTKVS